MDLSKLSTGKNPDNGQINAFIEIPLGSDIKYELDKDQGVMVADRFMFTAFHFPFNYGFIPNTIGQDGDPLDVLLVGDKTLFPGTVVACNIIGLLEMEDEAGVDHKVIAVPTEKIDPIYGAFKDINDVPVGIKNKMRHFFENYKGLEQGKWVKLKDWQGKEVALKALKDAIK